ncbi:MAG: endonuclease III [Acidobacteriota bacterium]
MPRTPSRLELPDPAPLPRESGAARRARARRFLKGLRRCHPDAGCTLDHRDPFQLLVATILSAQCTDERVNAVTPALFVRFPDPEAFASAEPSRIEAAIQSTGFFRNKARAIQGAARALLERHGGRVPEDLESLTALPGVGRKTANVIRAACFGAQAVIVDTHVKRVSRRLGLTGESDPVKIERDLMGLLPEGSWSFGSQAMILHGRRVCPARRPRCPECLLAPDCPTRMA